MSGFVCPFCNMVMSINSYTERTHYPSFESPNSETHLTNGLTSYRESSIAVTFHKCPNCSAYSINVKGIGEKVKDVSAFIRPASSAKQYPEYIPQQIRTDYEEACAVLHLSPKSSATLARRCLQGMIRDFWGIRKNNLNDEITALEDKVPADLWTALNNLRQLGNIGAHMEKDTNLIIDIDVGEADSLIQLIELLIKEWYIAREERKKLFESISLANAEKQALRKGKG